MKLKILTLENLLPGKWVLMNSTSLSCSNGLEVKDDHCLGDAQKPHIIEAIMFRYHGLDYGFCRVLAILIPSLFSLAMIPSDILHFNQASYFNFLCLLELCSLKKVEASFKMRKI